MQFFHVQQVQSLQRGNCTAGLAHFSPDAIRRLPPLIYHLDVEGNFAVLIF